MLAKLSVIYGGTTPNYWLDEHGLAEWMMFLRYGEEEMMHQAQILVGVPGASMSGKRIEPQKRLIVSSDHEEPDRSAFYRNPDIRKRINRGQ